MAIYYAGVGSRSTPTRILNIMEEIAYVLGEQGLTLRSGHARGADQAFERGAKDYKAELFVPWAGYEKHPPFSANHTVNHPNAIAIKSVSRFHPVPTKLSPGARKLHARNSQIILGGILLSPVSFVVCYTPLGKGSGGTGQAIRIANHYAIPVYDLGNKSIYEDFQGKLYGETLPGMENEWTSISL